MSNKLKAITTKAKALYKSGRYKKWTDAIKAASKTLSTGTSHKVSGVKKKAAPKKKAVKKAVKKTAVRNYGSHKDTASHNVKISVMSGDLKHHHWTTEFYIKTKKEILQRESVIKDVKSRKKDLVIKNGLTWFNNWIKDAQRTVTAQKKLLKKIKPFI